MSTSYLRRHWLIPVIQNSRHRFFDLSVSDHGIVWFDIWSKCKLYCVPSLIKVYHSRVGHPVFSVLFFNLLLKSLIFSRKSWVLVIIFSAKKWRERRILHHLSQSPCRKAASSWRERVTNDPLSDLRTHHFGLATPLIMYGSRTHKTFKFYALLTHSWSWN